MIAQFYVVIFYVRTVLSHIDNLTYFHQIFII